MPSSAVDAPRSPAIASAADEDRRIVALAFETEARAQDAMRAALRLQDQHLLTIHDAVFVTRDEAGHAEVTTTDPTPVAAAVPSSLFGALIGTLVAGPFGFLLGGVMGGASAALVARVVDTGIPHRVVGELQELTRPGQTVLALWVSDIAGMAVIEELRRFRDARVVYAQLPPAALELVHGALADRRGA